MIRAKLIIIGALAALLAMPSSADARRRGPPGIFGIVTAPLRMMMGIPRAAFGMRGRHYRRVAVRPRPYRRPPAAIAAPAVVAPAAAAAAAAASPPATLPTVTSPTAPNDTSSAVAAAPPVASPPVAAPPAAAPAAPGPAVAARDPSDRNRRAQSAWVGPLYWPAADDDVISYTFWPSGSDDKFWSRGFGDIFEAMFAPSATPRESGRRTSRVAVAELCSTRPASAAAGSVIEWIEKTAQPTDAQRGALDELRAALVKALDGIKAACPADKPLAPPERLEAMVDRLWTMRQAVIALRVPLESFYNALTDEQKTRLDGVRTPSVEAKVAAPETVGMSGPPAGRLCSGQATAMAEWPSGQIEQALRPTPEQQAGLEMLRQISLGMAGLLMASCPASTPATLVARLDSAQERLNTVLYVVRMITPALNNVYDSLSDEQKARFRSIGQRRQLGQIPDPNKLAGAAR